jgi:hypothetical protein
MRLLCSLSRRITVGREETGDNPEQAYRNSEPKHHPEEESDSAKDLRR